MLSPLVLPAPPPPLPPPPPPLRSSKLSSVFFLSTSASSDLLPFFLLLLLLYSSLLLQTKLRPGKRTALMPSLTAYSPANLYRVQKAGHYSSCDRCPGTRPRHPRAWAWRRWAWPPKTIRCLADALRRISPSACHKYVRSALDGHRKREPDPPSVASCRGSPALLLIAIQGRPGSLLTRNVRKQERERKRRETMRTDCPRLS